MPIAKNWAVSPTAANVWLLGSIERLIKPLLLVPLVTVKVAVPVTGPNDEDMIAVIVVVPALRGVASPDELMLATVGLLDDQVTESVMFWVWVGCEP